jgi:type VI secretion system secreted protein Hcp
MAVTDYFLKIDGIAGESHDSKHKGEIDVLGWDWGEKQQGTFALVGNGGGAGKVQMRDFRFKMRVNKATPKLLLACATGEHLKKAELVCRKAGKEQLEFLKITLSDVLVSSYDTGGDGGEVVPTDSITLNFAKLEVKYFPQKADGTADAAVRAGYDLQQMTVI